MAAAMGTRRTMPMTKRIEKIEDKVKLKLVGGDDDDHRCGRW